MKNNIAKIVQTVGAVLLVAAVILGVTSAAIKDPLGHGNIFVWSVAIAWWASGAVTFTFLLGLGEIIELLDRLVRKSNTSANQ